MNTKIYTFRLIGFILMVCSFQLSFAQIPTDGLVGYYMLDGNAADSSGMAHDGTIVGAVSPTMNRFGEADKASMFSGGYINAGNPTAYQITDAISIAFWMNPSQINDWSAIVTKWAGFGFGGYYIGINPASIAVRWNMDMPTPIEGNAVTIGEWMHVVTTYDGDTVKIFENGEVVSKLAYNEPLVNVVADLYIGDQFDFSNSGFNFNGAIDDVLIYNRGLSDAEVADIYDFQLTSINDIFIENSVDVFPNPTKGVLSIQNKSDYPIQSYSLFNATGMLMKTAPFQEELDISGQSAGIYYLLLNYENTSTTKKVIKQ